MGAMQTSMPRTAPAKAAVASGIGLSALSADRRPVTPQHAEYRLGIGQFRNRSETPDRGSEGVAVI
jgi:hypothetical protein